jgi:phosphotransacetylase
MTITKLEQMFDLLKSKPKKRIAVAFANDAHTIEAVYAAVEKGIVEATLTGDEANIKKICQEHHMDAGKFEILNEPNEIKAADQRRQSQPADEGIAQHRQIHACHIE